MISERSFNISNLIRFLVIPVILLMTIGGGRRLNDTVYDIINFGFTSKLSTLASISGAFVKLEEHEVLIRPQMMHNIHVTESGELFALNEHGEIVNLYLDGSATLLPAVNLTPKPTNIRDFVITPGSIFILTHQAELLEYDRLGNLLKSHQHNQDLNALGMSNSSGNVLVSDLDGQIFSVEDVETLNLFSETNQADITDFTAVNDSLLILLTADQQIIQFDVTSTDSIQKNPINCGDDVESCHDVFAITFDEQQNHLWAISNQLLKLDINGVIDWDHYTHSGFHDHTSEFYLDYVIPMQNVRERQQLTYLYSFKLNEEDRTISYVLDSSTDDDFTHIGYVDSELSEFDFQSAQQILLTNNTYVSEIKPWGQWGLVKIGFAPISDQNNQSGAVMGADLNVSLISQVSREALVILSLSSFFFLLLGGLASWYFSKTLTAPLLQLKDNVLGIAGGFLDKPILKPGLVDLQPLADLFQKAGNKLKKEVVSGPMAMQNFEKQRRDQDLNAYLKLKMYPGQSSFFDIKYDLTDKHEISSIAMFANSNVAVGWHINTQANELESIRIHNAIYSLVQNFQTADDKPDSLINQLLNIFEKEIQSLVLIDATHKSGVIFNSNEALIDMTTIDGEEIVLSKSELGKIKQIDGLFSVTLHEVNEKSSLKILIKTKAGV